MLEHILVNLSMCSRTIDFCNNVVVVCLQFLFYQETVHARKSCQFIKCPRRRPVSPCLCNDPSMYGQRSVYSFKSLVLLLLQPFRSFAHQYAYHIYRITLLQGE